MFGSISDCGVIPRSIEFLFSNMPSQFQVKASVMEIYNETLNDLLNEPKTLSNSKFEKIVVESPQQFLNVLEKVKNKRKHSATSRNAFSSRSHAIIQLEVNGRTAEKTITSQIMFFDLAGCENLNEFKFLLETRREKKK